MMACALHTAYLFVSPLLARKISIDCHLPQRKLPRLFVHVSGRTCGPHCSCGFAAPWHQRRQAAFTAATFLARLVLVAGFGCNLCRHVVLPKDGLGTCRCDNLINGLTETGRCTKEVLYLSEVRTGDFLHACLSIVAKVGTQGHRILPINSPQSRRPVTRSEQTGSTFCEAWPEGAFPVLGLVICSGVDAFRLHS